MNSASVGTTRRCCSAPRRRCSWGLGSAASALDAGFSLTDGAIVAAFDLAAAAAAALVPTLGVPTAPVLP